MTDLRFETIRAFLRANAEMGGPHAPAAEALDSLEADWDVSTNGINLDLFEERKQQLYSLRAEVASLQAENERLTKERDDARDERDDWRLRFSARPSVAAFASLEARLNEVREVALTSIEQSIEAEEMPRVVRMLASITDPERGDSR